MKKWACTICMLFVFVGFTTQLKASERKLWGGNIGVNYWYPDWTNEQSQFDSSTSGVYGPVCFLYYKNLGIGAQYYTGEFDLDFPGASSSISADRIDIDVMLSYRIADVFQLSVLYKQIEFDWEQTFKANSEITGFGFGGGFNKVFPSRFLMYGFGYYMPGLDYEQEISSAGTYTGDADGYWLEGGIGYVVTDFNILAKLGYRYQSIDIESGITSWSEETSGVRIDICYFF